MVNESLLHCSALLMVNFTDRDRSREKGLYDFVLSRAAALKRRYERRPPRGYRDEEPGTGLFVAFDAPVDLVRLIRNRGFKFPEGYEPQDSHRDVCFHFKYAPGRSRSSDPRGTRYTIDPCPLSTDDHEIRTPHALFCRLRDEVFTWSDPSGCPLFDLDTAVFLVGARPLPMIEMFTSLQPHDFLDAFPDSGLNPVQPQTGNLLFVQLQNENLSRWRLSGPDQRRRSMGALFTSRVLAPGDSYAIELHSTEADPHPSSNRVYVDRGLLDNPDGLGYICRIHDGFSAYSEDPSWAVAMRESFLPGIERPDVVSRFCRLREAEIAALKFNTDSDSVRISRGGKLITELGLNGGRSNEIDGLVGEIRFDPGIPKLTVRLPFLFFPDIELPARLVDRSVVVEWANDHRQEARHTISYWAQEQRLSHRAQCLRVLSGRLLVHAEYLGSGKARAGLDNILVYRDDFHLETAERLMRGAGQSTRRADLTRPFNSVFTGRTPDNREALDAFADVMISMHATAEDGGRSRDGIGPFVASSYSFVFREPRMSL